MQHFQTNSDIIPFQFTNFPCKFGSLQVKRNLISSIILFVYELHHEFPNEFRLNDIKKLGNKKNFWK